MKYSLKNYRFLDIYKKNLLNVTKLLRLIYFLLFTKFHAVCPEILKTEPFVDTFQKKVIMWNSFLTNTYFSKTPFTGGF